MLSEPSGSVPMGCLSPHVMHTTGPFAFPHKWNDTQPLRRMIWCVCACVCACAHARNLVAETAPELNNES